MIIIGITGTLGAGKGTVVDYLLKEKGFKHYSARVFITEEINRRGLPINRDSMVQVGNEMREAKGPAAVVEALYEQAKKDGADAIIESIRTPGEVLALRGQANFYLLAVDADRKIRYERIKARASATDQVSFEEFCAQEDKEMTSTDPNKQNLGECIRQADFVIDNNGSFTDLTNQVEKILTIIIK